jgi:GNAT superfamily N-acetyltransferase
LNTAFFAALALDDDGNIVSSAFLLIFEKPFNPHWPTGKTGTILNVRTNPAYRKQGYATKLLNLLIDVGKQQNLSYIDLAASEMGQPIYEKLGFRKPEATRYTEMELPLFKA